MSAKQPTNQPDDSLANGDCRPASCSSYPSELRERRRQIERDTGCARNESCPLEEEVRQALKDAEIRFIEESAESKFLDFYLPDFGVYIEVKGGTSPRTAKQLERDHNVILIQGRKAAAFIAGILRTNTKEQSSRSD